jgi:lipoprotein-releasing system permease protein
MSDSFSWVVARRYLTARRKQAFISLISAVSILGVGVGVMALVIALALMTGVQGELRDRIVGSAAHVYVWKISGRFHDSEEEYAQLRSIEGVVDAAPAITGLGLITIPESTANAAPVSIKGIDPARETKVTQIESAVRAGSLAPLSRPVPPGQTEPIVLGSELARNIGASLNDQVLVLTTQLTLTLSGPMPRVHVFHVAAIVEFGFYQTDSQSAFVSLAKAGEMLNKEGPELVQLRLEDMNQAHAIRDRIEDKFGSEYLVEDWTELNKELYAALWLEKVAISFTIGLIVMVAALNIVASLILLVMEKSRDIAILRTMGARAAAIRRIFIYQGLAIGTIGTVIGTILGLIVCYVADRYQLIKLPSDVYQITYLPFRVEVLDVIVVFILAILICFAATIHPARQAARLDPAEALRNQ